MLFFKDLREEFMEDPDFRERYEQECHICLNTMSLVSCIEQMEDKGQALLKRLRISETAYQDLARGDRCNPEEVSRLAAALKMDSPGMFDKCPRRRNRQG